LKRFSEKGLPAFLEEWPQFDFLKGKTIDFLAPTGLVHGIAQGIDVEGRLLIQLPDGKTQSFSSGEIKALA
jgi:BirA family biotin operon repressor/biotin-[acetyl-CoA-carboxylase] ligase